jgi:hypothetical protein
MTDRLMLAEHVVEVYDLLAGRGIGVWVDGGGGVDALLERQTREHGDLDIAIQVKDLPIMRELLEQRGYRDKGEPNARPWNFVLKDPVGTRNRCPRNNARQCRQWHLRPAGKRRNVPSIITQRDGSYCWSSSSLHFA